MNGEVIDERYRIVRQIGAGGMGVVFEAEHVHMHRRVAIKLLREALGDDAEAVARLEREAQLTGSLGHPNIVQCLDFGRARDGRVYLAMEWLEGETLEARLQRAPIDLDTALDVAAQACAGLVAAHARGVVHRDLKPANLFLARDASGTTRVKILDFGIATLVEQQSKLTAAGSLLGTPSYMSPEQALGETVDERADLYAMGVILYEMSTGVVPFRGESPIAVLHQHSEIMPVPPTERAPERGIPAAVEQIVMRCLAKRASDRYASARELLADLEAARSGAPLISATAQTLRANGKMSATSRARSIWWISLAVGVAAAALAITLAVSRSGDATTPAVAPSPPVTHHPDATTVGAALDAAFAPVVVARGHGAHFGCTVSVPAPPIADQPFEAVLDVASADPGISTAIASGTLDARVVLRIAHGHGLVHESRVRIDRQGRATASLLLEDAGKYHVHVDLLHAGQELDSADLDLWAVAR